VRIPCGHGQERSLAKLLPLLAESGVCIAERTIRDCIAGVVCVMYSEDTDEQATRDWKVLSLVWLAMESLDSADDVLYTMGDKWLGAEPNVDVK